MTVSPESWIENQRDGAGETLLLDGELDAAAAPRLAAEFERRIAEGDLGELVLDLSAVTFIDSSGMRAIIDLERMARERGLALRVIEPPDEVTALMRTTGLTDRLAIGPQPLPPDPDFIERIELELPVDTSAPSIARREIRGLAAELDDHTVSAATLLVSEVVTNAVVHPEPASDGGGILLAITTTWRGVRVEVSDSGRGFDPDHPVLRNPEFGGRGLGLVDRLAARWGAAPHADRFRVWFEVDAAADGAPASS